MYFLEMNNAVDLFTLCDMQYSLLAFTMVLQIAVTLVFLTLMIVYRRHLVRNYVSEYSIADQKFKGMLNFMYLALVIMLLMLFVGFGVADYLVFYRSKAINEYK